VSKPTASLSLDLDNAWSYLKTRGDPSWRELPSYLNVVVPRCLELFERLGLRVTVFVVGQDAALPENRAVLGSIAVAGHEIGNHSFHHEPWLHRYDAGAADAEIASAHEAIAGATGVEPRGFRGPGYSVSPSVLGALARRSYRYDASTLPTFVGPAARAYYFLTAGRLAPHEREQRGALFGTLRDGLRPLRPYAWEIDGRSMLEIPVTTFPVLKVPIHFSYVLWLATWSPAVALAYFRSALRACRAAEIGPSLLLHPLDLLDVTDAPALAFFPAMGMPREKKTAVLTAALRSFQATFNVVPLEGHAATIASGGMQPRTHTLSSLSVPR
jgi:peptidoglycan/xylan/chitin deacetylase (PgdA/CDA1 family)